MKRQHGSGYMVRVESSAEGKEIEREREVGIMVTVFVYLRSLLQNKNLIWNILAVGGSYSYGVEMGFEYICIDALGITLKMLWNECISFVGN